jgi:hypothetical protein
VIITISLSTLFFSYANSANTMAHKQTSLFLLLVCLNYLVSATYHYKHSLKGDFASRRESVLWMKAGDNDTTTTQKNISYPVPDAKYGPFYMTMPLDHFTNASATTFDNKYWVNADYYKSNGPIICMRSMFCYTLK